MAKSKRVPPEGWSMKDETPWPGNNGKDHPAMIQILLGHDGGNELPCLVYMSREKRPAFHHHSKAGAINAAVCKHVRLDYFSHESNLSFFLIGIC